MGRNLLGASMKTDLSKLSNQELKSMAKAALEQLKYNNEDVGNFVPEEVLAELDDAYREVTDCRSLTIDVTIPISIIAFIDDNGIDDFDIEDDYNIIDNIAEKIKKSRELKAENTAIKKELTAFRQRVKLVAKKYNVDEDALLEKVYY